MLPYNVARQGSGLREGLGSSEQLVDSGRQGQTDRGCEDLQVHELLNELLTASFDVDCWEFWRVLFSNQTCIIALAQQKKPS